MNSKHSYFLTVQIYFFLELFRNEEQYLSYSKVLGFHFCLLGLQPISTTDRHPLFAGFDLTTRLGRHLGSGA